MTQTNRQRAEGNRYPNIVRFVRETPWAILETTLRAIQETLAVYASGRELTEEEIQARIGSGPARRDSYVTAGNVAVIPIYGVITPRADVFSEMSGGTSTDRLRESIAAAANDPEITSILLDVDSPGGSVSMLQETAAAIRDARKAKPVVAVANSMAASAAYHLASQASEFLVTPSGSVGSIGVIAAHDDVSALQEKLGVKTTLVTAGKNKAELSPFKPLTDDAKAQIQKIVDTHYAAMTQDIARGRRVSVDTVRSEQFGQGRMLLAKDAVAAGLVDGVATFDATLTRLQRTAGSASGPTALGDDPPPEAAETEETPDEAALSGLSFADEADALRASADAIVDRVTSLAEVRRGALTGAKRDRLTACTGALRESVTALEGVLTDTDPHKQRAEEGAVIGEYLARLTGGISR